jgi:transglutaminase-like putative cysteine protease
LDAVTALTCQGGGSCTNRANLAAALLRVRGIPARTIAHLPTWSLGEALFTHWLVEYWHPKAGWTSIESTWGEFQPPPYTTMVVAISSSHDEDLANDKLQTRWVLPGAPMWAMAHIGEDLVPSSDKNQQANWARPEVRLSATDPELHTLFRKASELYERLLQSRRFADEKRYARIEKAMASRTAHALLRAIAE